MAEEFLQLDTSRPTIQGIEMEEEVKKNWRSGWLCKNAARTFETQNQLVKQLTDSKKPTETSRNSGCFKCGGPRMKRNYPLISKTKEAGNKEQVVTPGNSQGSTQ